MTGLSVLVVDDEPPALDELAYLLGGDERVGAVRTAGSATDALRLLHEHEVDAVFLDVQMPGLTGLDVAGVLGRFQSPPAVVFVTAHEEHALAAFGLDAVDYVLKPVRAERLRDAVRRVVGTLGQAPQPAGSTSDQVVVELGGTSRLVPRSAIAWVEAQGDYVRLHTADDSHLVRASLSTLAEEWAADGFVRVHRSLLVSLAHVSQVRSVEGRCTADVAGTALGVSRRHTREFRERWSAYWAGQREPS